MKYKKIMIFLIICILSFIISIIIYNRKPSYEKIKGKLELTQYIIIYDLSTPKKIKYKIKDREKIDDIIKILKNAKISTDEWEYPTSDKYKLEFYNDKIIFYLVINTNNNNPVHIKYKNYDYPLEIEEIELLIKNIDNYIHLNTKNKSSTN